VHLRLSGKSRLFNLCGLIIYMGLAVCVFTWGLQYKLSLYDPPQAASHQIPQAKLLSKNEQTDATQSPLVMKAKSPTRVSYTGPTTTFFILLLALSVLVKTPSPRKQLRELVQHLHRGLFDIFFVRPPPILA
jgi:hypothetical protein